MKAFILQNLIFIAVLAVYVVYAALAIKILMKKDD
jgi:hypothetical protein